MMFKSRKRAIGREALRLSAEQAFMDRYIQMTADLGKPKPMQHLKLGDLAEFTIPKNVKLLPLLEDITA